MSREHRRGGKRLGAGRPRAVVLTGEDEWFIASEVFRRRNDLAATAHDAAIDRKLTQLSPSHVAWKVALDTARDERDARLAREQVALAALIGLTKGERSAGRARLRLARKWTAGEVTARADAAAENRLVLRALRKVGAIAGLPTRPKNALDRIASEVAADMTKLLSMPISKTRVLECWKAHSALFNQADDL